MDDVECGVESIEQLIPSIKLIFNCLRKSGLKLSREKSLLGSEKVRVLGNVVTKEGLQPEKKTIEKFVETLEIPNSVKQVKRIMGFLHLFRSFIPNLNDHLVPFYKLLRENVSFEITNEIKNSFAILSGKLETTTTQLLRLAEPGLQSAILFDVCYHSSRFVLMIEDYVKTTKERLLNLMHLSHSDLKLSMQRSWRCQLSEGVPIFVLPWKRLLIPYGVEKNRYSYWLTTKVWLDSSEPKQFPLHYGVTCTEFQHSI